MVQRYGFDEWGSTFGKRESGVYVDIDDYLTLEQRCRELEESCEDWRKNCLAYIEGLNMTEKRLEEIEAENAELRKRLENLK